MAAIRWSAAVIFSIILVCRVDVSVCKESLDGVIEELAKQVADSQVSWSSIGVAKIYYGCRLTHRDVHPVVTIPPLN